MDEDISIINTKTRNERIKEFFVNNKKLLFSSFVIIVLFILSFYSYLIYIENNKIKLSEKYNKTVIESDKNNQSQTIASLKEIINEKDSTYSPLALYFLIDNELISENKEVNNLFDILIEKTSLKTEIKNLIIYKKALYNADLSSENELLDILKPIINSESVWKSHALYLLAEYFFSKNEIEKSKEFFNQILEIDNANQNLIKEVQKRLKRDLSE